MSLEVDESKLDPASTRPVIHADIERHADQLHVYVRRNVMALRPHERRDAGKARRDRGIDRLKSCILFHDRPIVKGAMLAGPYPARQTRRLKCDQLSNWR